MQQHGSIYYVLTHALDPLGRVKTFFLKVVLLHIKLMGRQHRAPASSYSAFTPCKLIVCPYTHPQLSDGVNGSKHFLMKLVMLHIKLK